MKIAVALSISSWVTAAYAGSNVSLFPLGSPAKIANVLSSIGDDGTRLGSQDELTSKSHGGLLDASSTRALGLSFVDERGAEPHNGAPENAPTELQTAREPGHVGPKLRTPPTSRSPVMKSPSDGTSPRENAFAGVVKIFVDTVKADFVSPWQVMAPTELTGSGFVVEGKKIMTNAHLVTDQTRVLVRKHGNPKRYIASILSVCHECDLALLTVADEAFWDGLVPLAFGGIPQLRESVAVLGYPTGGDQLSITEGVVSRVGVSKYAHSSLGLLTVQIDAAINPGNSGGPAVSGGKVVGVAFQGFNQMQNVGYIVPYPVIRHFLNDVTLHKRHTGIISMGIKTQTIENEALRRSKGMDVIPPGALPDNVTAEGVLVMEVDKLRTTIYAKGKIILPISRYGCVPSKASHCTLSRGECQSTSAPGKDQPCKLKELELLENKPAAPPGDISEHQRQVKEVDARVIWQPDNWQPSTPESTCTDCHLVAREQYLAIKRHRALLAPEKGVQNYKEKRIFKEPGKGHEIVPRAEEGEEDSSPSEKNKNITAPDIGSVETNKDALANPPGTDDKSEAVKPKEESQAASTSNTAKNGNMDQKTTDIDKLEPSTNFSGDSDASGSVQREENQKSRSDTKDSVRENGIGETAQGLIVSSPSRQAAKISQAQATLRSGQLSSAQLSIDAFIRKIIGSRAGLNQVRRLLNLIDSRTVEAKTDLDVPLQSTRHLRASSRNGTQKLGISVMTPQQGFEERSGDDQAHSEKTQDPDAVIDGREQKAPTEARNVSDRSGLRKSPSDEAEQELDALKVDGRHERGPVRQVQKEKLGDARESEASVSPGLAAAVHPVVDNPYFDPELLSENEFFGLREGDVLLSIGNYNIAGDGTVALRDLERVAFTYIVTHFFNGETTFAYVLRDGRIIKVTVPLMAPNIKVPPFAWDTKPSYFVYGGFVFTPLSKALLFTKLQREVPHMFEYLVQKLEYQDEEGDEYVVLSLVLASDVSVGYEQRPCIVRSVNGQTVRHMRDLVRYIEETVGDFVKFQLDINGTDNLQIVIDKKMAEKTQQKVLTDHNITSDRSSDLI